MCIKGGQDIHGIDGYEGAGPDEIVHDNLTEEFQINHRRDKTNTSVTLTNNEFRDRSMEEDQSMSPKC